jgi:hypothetical protein
MSANGSKSAKVRAKLNHPIIDTDGHTVEFTPVFFDYIKEVGGAGMIERYKKAVGSRANNRWAELSEEERRYTRATCPALVGAAGEKYSGSSDSVLAPLVVPAHG